jgi:hypothetical protein
VALACWPYVSYSLDRFVHENILIIWLSHNILNLYSKVENVGFFPFIIHNCIVNFTTLLAVINIRRLYTGITQYFIFPVKFT